MVNAAWGIDLGNRALKAVKLVRDESGVRVDDFDVIEHEQIASVAGDNRESLLRTALASFVERHPVKSLPVAVSISGAQSFARFIKLPPVESRKIPEVVRFEAIQQIPFPLDDVEWAYQLFPQKDSPEVEVGIFAIKKEIVSRHIAYFTDLRMNVQVVQMHPLAVYNAMVHDGRVGQTVMFMDAGAECIDLIIADGQTVWLRTLSAIGGNTFTESLVKAFKLPFSKAEELKRSAATSKYAKQIFQAMRPVFADLVAEIQRSMGFYASVHRDARIQKIVAQGSTFQLPGLQKYLQQSLQIPVEKLDSLKAAPPADPKMAAAFQEHVISLAGAYGLALQALDGTAITVSLLPASIRRAKMWRDKAKWFAAAASLFVLGTVGAAGRLYFDGAMYERNEEARAAYRKTTSEASRLVNQWKTRVENRGEDDRQRIVSFAGLTDYRTLWPEILRDIFDALPPNDVEKLRKKPREEREQILISRIRPEYKTDLTDVLKVMAERGDVGRFLGVESANPAISAPPAYGGEGGEEKPVVRKVKRGFLVTIRGVTPNKGGVAFVESRLCKALLEKTADAQAKAGKPYYVGGVQLIQSGRRTSAQTPLHGAAGGMSGETDIADFTGLTPLSSPGNVPGASGGSVRPVQPSYVPGMPGGGGAVTPGGGRVPGRAATPPAGGAAPAGAPGSPDAVEGPPKDPFFPDETIEKDTEFAVVVAVVLDPAPAQTTTENE